MTILSIIFIIQTLRTFGRSANSLTNQINKKIKEMKHELVPFPIQRYLQIMVHIFTVYATIFLFALHVSTLMGHHQVLLVTHRLLLTVDGKYINHY
jgi:hypothetical protein